MVFMKNIYWTILMVIIVIVGIFLYTRNNTSTEEATIDSHIKVIPINHATAVIEWDDDVIYLDPLGGLEAFKGQPTPDMILVTDIHPDHLSTTTLNAFIGNFAVIVPQAVKNLIKGQPIDSVAQVADNGDMIGVQDYVITAIPMYNLPESEASPHTKGRGNGYLIEKGGLRVYIAGDTSGTPEMREMGDIDIAFVPMNLPYTMSVEEAADAVVAFKPKIVYPYHYRGQDGLSDINKFKELVNAGDSRIIVRLENWYPDNNE